MQEHPMRTFVRIPKLRLQRMEKYLQACKYRIYTQKSPGFPKRITPDTPDIIWGVLGYNDDYMTLYPTNWDFKEIEKHHKALLINIQDLDNIESMLSLMGHTVNLDRYLKSKAPTQYIDMPF